jgi:predicted DNA-binding transcriptional regulator AlpA
MHLLVLSMENVKSPTAGNNQATLLPGAEAAAFLRLSRSNFQIQVKAGKIPPPIRITPARPVGCV